MANKHIQLVSTPKATPAGGHYSQATISNGLIFVSGQLGFKPGTNEKQDGDIKQESFNCLENLRLILEECGATTDDLVKVTIYISDVEYWPVVNSVYADYLGEHKPARAIVPCNVLHYGFNVEIEAIAKANTIIINN
ncbi:MAG: RidA family protein [Paraglaciecola sp.]|uniref:RidA family protein n=1 Tax=Paraglaciecola sp. TaxID=1920173 RepID=UPI003263C67D